MVFRQQLGFGNLGTLRTVKIATLCDGWLGDRQSSGLLVKQKNPHRADARRINGAKRRPWNDEDRQRLRRQCLERKPWVKSTGPRTDEGKYRAKANGFYHHTDPNSVRQAKVSIFDVNDIMMEMAELRRSIHE